MEKKLTYSPAEVCDLFDISKSTLLRWERENIISPAKRDSADQRQYAEENLREIGQQLKRQIVTQFKRTNLSNNNEELNKAYENLYIWKFILNEPTALDELENYPILSSQAIRKLHRIGLERYEPSSPMFCRVAKIIAQKSEKLSLSKNRV